MEAIFSSITAYTSAINIGDVITTLLAALVFGLVIAVTYIKTQKNGLYSESLAVTLTILPIILAMIILFVGSNVARAFSLAGTLSIIRFRSAPGEPKDIGYIFFDIAAGLACGVGQYVYGAVFVAVVCIFMIVIHKTRFASLKTSAKRLKIVIPEDLDYENAFEDIFKKYTTEYKLIKIKTTDLGSLFELAYNVSMKEDGTDKAFIDELRCRNGNLSIILSLVDAPL